jgi:lipopolysaccharide transport system permease protein
MGVTLPKTEVTQNYPLFLFAGQLPWLLFSDTVPRSASSVLEQGSLITKTVFPAEIIPNSVFLSTLVGHLLGLALMVGAVALILNQISIFLVLLPPIRWRSACSPSDSVGSWLVCTFFLRDTAQVVSVILTLWFWVTHILISEQRFPTWARFVLLANPLFYLVRAYRELLLSSRLPSARDLVIVAVYSSAAFVLGGLFFRHMKRGFADVL